MNFAMSILKSADGDGSSCQRYTYAYSNPLNGKGKFIHTYKCDGNPLPSYEGEPKTVVIPDTDIDTFTSMVWENLNADNKVSLFTRYINIATGKYESRIIKTSKRKELYYNERTSVKVRLQPQSEAVKNIHGKRQFTSYRSA
jgi:hypothetical protein